MTELEEKLFDVTIEYLRQLGCIELDSESALAIMLRNSIFNECLHTLTDLYYRKNNGDLE